MKTTKWISIIVGASLISACGEKNQSGDKLLSAEGFKSLENQPAAQLSDREGKIVKQAMLFGISSVFRLYAKDAPEHSLRAIRDIAVNAVGVMYDKDNNLSEAIDDTGKCSSGGTLVTKGNVTANSKPGSTVEFSANGSATFTISSCGGNFFDQKIEPITGELQGKASFSGTVQQPATATQKPKIDSNILSSLDGSFSGSIDNSAYKAELKNFGVAYQLSSAKIEEWKQIKLDLLGHDEQVERKREFLRSVLKCMGSTVIEGKEYDCAAIVNWVIEQSQK